MNRIVRVGTRGSELALTQTNWVIDRLRALHPQVTFAVEIVKTTGDLDHQTSLPAMGGRGVFVKEVEEALLSGRVDMAVHSMKDLPGQMPPGLQISAIPTRVDPRDCLISKNGCTLDQLPAGSLVGTGSPRRRAQLCLYRPDLRFAELRGNVDTRINRVLQGEYDAIVLAVAGLSRLGRQLGQPIATEICLPAVGQGALALQTRSDDPQTIAIVAALDDPAARQAVLAERTVLTELGGGCHTPIAALGLMKGAQLQLTGAVADTAGNTLLRVTRSADATSARELGQQVARALLDAGAASLI